MNNLLNFLVKYSSWLLFIVFAAISCVLLFTTNPFQHHVFLTSAGSVASGIYRASSNVTGYFALRDINEDLQRRNSQLELEVLSLKEQLKESALKLYADTMRTDSVFSRYSFIIGHVINNSVSRPHNYITIDRGSLDGVKPEMGVIDQNGVVGIVNVVGPHSARVISLLNPMWKLACKVKGSEHSGSLQWDGRDPREAVLLELPRHARFHKGDTIVTNGFSTAFPEGVPVGTVVASKAERDNNFLALRVKLFTDFSTLSTVRIVDDSMVDELRSVERDIEITTEHPGQQ